MIENGLPEKDWLQVIDTLEKVVDYYDKMNNYATFFQAEKWRKEAAKYSDDNLDVLEIGCGPGSFAKHLKSKELTCLDPSEKLLRIAKNRINHNASLVPGQAENMPLESGKYDRIFCSFSFRDLRDQKRGLNEMFRTQKDNGKLIILDMAKYEKGLRAFFMSMHIKYFVPVIARFVIPRKLRQNWGRNPYKDLWETYRSFKTPNDIAKMVYESGYRDVELRLLSLGGAFLIVANKPKSKINSN